MLTKILNRKKRDRKGGEEEGREKRKRKQSKDKKRRGGAASDNRETKIGDASFHMTSGDVMKMDGRPRWRA